MAGYVTTNIAGDLETVGSEDFALVAGSAESRAAELARSMICEHPEAGGVVTFDGRVRNHQDGRTVRRLAYSVYHELAVHEGRAIVREATERFGLSFARALHAYGDLDIGDMAVWVYAGAAHRDEAFRACRFMINEIKRRLPVWKDEFYEDGSHGWVSCSH